METKTEHGYRSAGPWLAEAHANWPICKKALMEINIVELLDVKIWYIVSNLGNLIGYFFSVSSSPNKFKGSYQDVV